MPSDYLDYRSPTHHSEESLKAHKDDPEYPVFLPQGKKSKALTRSTVMSQPLHKQSNTVQAKKPIQFKGTVNDIN